MASSDIAYTRYSFTLVVYFEMIFQKYNLGFNCEKYILSFYCFLQICAHYQWKKNAALLIKYFLHLAMINDYSFIFTFAFRTDFLTILQRCHTLYQTCIHNTCWWYTRNLCSCFQMQRCQVSPNCLNILAHYQYYTFLRLCIAVHWPYLDRFCHIHTNLKPNFHLRSNMYNILNLPQQQIVVIPRFFSLFGYGHFGCKEI